MPRKAKKSLGGDQMRRASSDATMIVSPPSDTVITLITLNYRKRKFAMEQRKRSDLAMGAFLRGVLGWRKDLPEAERKAIAAKAAALAKSPEGSEWENVIQAHVKSREPFDAIEKAALKEMAALAETLPAWVQFGEEIRGFGAASLATIVAEAGNLSNYPTIPKLWKRMGLAVIDGVRQGGLGKGAGAEAWITHGYSPMRRSAVWNIGDTMLKAQVRKVKDDDGEDTGERTSLGKYGAIYLERKELEIARNPDIPPIAAHRKAQRIMEKRLLKDLWRAWRRDHKEGVERPGATCPDAEVSRVAA